MNITRKKAVIYYFTGTGNSLMVAETIAAHINADTVDISAFDDTKEVAMNHDIAGFVFPVYDFKAPEYMQKFLTKLKNIENKYLFAVGTYGVAPSKCMLLFQEAIQKAGGKLSLGFAVQMPHNGIGSGIFSEKQNRETFSRWDKRKGDIFQAIASRESRPVDKNNPGELLKIYLLQGTVFKMIPTLSKMLVKVAFHGWDSIAYTAGDKCNGCGICEKICPVDNIHMQDGKPFWSDHCANCFACLQWCPQSAITPGNTNLNIKKYHHPDMSLSDILKKREVKS